MYIPQLIQSFQDPYGFHAFVQGILFILLFYNMLMFLQNKNKMFLYYSIFVGFLFLYFTHHDPNMFHGISVPGGVSIFLQGTQFVAYIFYISYVQEVIDSKKNIPKWHCVLQFAKITLLSCTILFAILEYVLSPKELYVYVLFVFIVTEIFAIINYFIFYKIKGLISKLLILGSVVYMICANISLFDGNGNAQNHHFNYGMFMEVGAVFESLVFALILGYRMDILEKEQKKFKIQLLQKTIEASEMKMKALKAQMNPHFIFNVLNSINNFIIKNNRQDASDYLTQFAKLIRSILNHSEVNTISLQSELQSIDRYVNLEKLRISNSFDYQLTISKEVNPEKIEVPPLFLQPYIENAIWYGLNGKNGYKLLSLDICKTNNHLVITIKDNGVGRKNSRCNLSFQKAKSFGTKITEERIKMVYPKTFVSIKDVLCPKLHENTGTQVSINFPDILPKT